MVEQNCFRQWRPINDFTEDQIRRSCGRGFNRFCRMGFGASLISFTRRGLVYCQECGSRYASIGRDYLACSAARGSGTCSNRQSIRRVALEGLIINGLRQRLMAPELVEEFVRSWRRC
jgi:Recombinase zinc beta ribbon domain